MIDPLATMQTLLVIAPQLNPDAILGERVFVGPQLPAGYTPSDRCLLISIPASRPDYSSRVLIAKVAFRCYGRTSAAISEVASLLFDVLHERKIAAIKQILADNPVPQIVPDPKQPTWLVGVVFYIVHFRI